jgi:predicted enzyme related to lactoylglutathione lyase
MPKVVHFEIPADDVERAKSFYGSVFDWELQTVPMGEGEYTTVKTAAVDEQTQMPNRARRHQRRHDAARSRHLCCTGDHDQCRRH